MDFQYRFQYRNTKAIQTKHEDGSNHDFLSLGFTTSSILKYSFSRTNCLKIQKSLPNTIIISAQKYSNETSGDF